MDQRFPGAEQVYESFMLFQMCCMGVQQQRSPGVGWGGGGNTGKLLLHRYRII